MPVKMLSRAILRKLPANQDLAAINIGEVDDGVLVNWLDHGLYRLEKASTATAKDFEIIKPDAATNGRWIIQNGSLLVSDSEILNPHLELPAWTVLAAYTNNNSGLAGCGIWNSAIMTGGTVIGANKVNTFNGSNWTAQNDLPDNYLSHSACGTISDTLITGGGTQSKLYAKRTGSGDFSTQSPNLLYSCVYHGSCGTANDALLAGCSPLDEYKKTLLITDSVQAGPESPVPLKSCRLVGTKSAALSAGSEEKVSNTSYGVSWGTEFVYSFNGTAWSGESRLLTGRFWHCATGTDSDALIWNGAKMVSIDKDSSTPTPQDSAVHEQTAQRYNGITWAIDAIPLAVKTSAGFAGNGDDALEVGGSTLAVTGIAIVTTDKNTVYHYDRKGYRPLNQFWLRPETAAASAKIEMTLYDGNTCGQKKIICEELV